MITVGRQRPVKQKVPPEMKLDRPTVTSVAPQIDQGLLLPAEDLEFPRIAYQHSGAPFFQAIYTPTALTPLFERGALMPAASWEFPTIIWPRKQGKDEDGHTWAGALPIPLLSPPVNLLLPPSYGVSRRISHSIHNIGDSLTLPRISLI